MSTRWRSKNCQDCVPSIFLWRPGPRRKQQSLKHWVWIFQGNQDKSERLNYTVKPMRYVLRRTGGFLLDSMMLSRSLLYCDRITTIISVWLMSVASELLLSLKELMFVNYSLIFGSRISVKKLSQLEGSLRDSWLKPR